jgi:hypothetical protein
MKFLILISVKRGLTEEQRSSNCGARTSGGLCLSFGGAISLCEGHIYFERNMDNKIFILVGTSLDSNTLPTT